MNDIVNAITIPALDSAEYASGLNSAFENINRNFMTLGNSGFLKGQMGDSVRVIEKPLYENGEYTELGTKLLNAVKANATETELGSVTIGNTTLSWDDNIKLKPTIQVICNDATDGTDIVVSSLYYMVFDGRYANTELGFADEEEYLGKKDVSCIVMYNGVEDKFEVMTDSFPTLYYEDGVGLCWRINGSNTGLPVRGLTGKDGQNATFDVIKCGIPIKDGETVYSEVTHIFEQFYGYRPLEEYNAADVEFRLNGQSVIILAPTIEDSDSGNSFYFGKVGKKDDKLYGYFGTGTSVSTAINIEEIVNLLKNISITASSEDISSKIKGLFIPMDKEQEDGTQAVHLMSATGIVNEVGNTSSRKTDFIFTPIDDINKLDITPEKPLEVGKFLYLEIDSNSGIFDSNHPISWPRPTVKIPHKVAYKYKLDSVIYSTRTILDELDPRFESYNDENIELSSKIGVASRYLGKIIYDGDATEFAGQHNLTDDNIVYVHNSHFTTDQFEAMPTEFNDRLVDGRGIYKWVLCNDVHTDFDADSLKYLYDNEVAGVGSFDSYKFDNRFNTVFTMTATPGISDTIMWFNGMELYNDVMYDSNGTAVDIYTDTANQTVSYPIVGWTTNTPFIFHKFVPVYFNAHIEDTDTCMNLNYNVNITGISDDARRNLNVHGDVNCENINVYHLTATGEIKNIYTKDTIVSDSGINLRDVNADGEVVNMTSITPNDVNTNTINAESINADIVSPEQLKVLSTNVDVMSNDGKGSALTINNYEPRTGDRTTVQISGTYSADYDNFLEKIKNDTSIDINNVKQLNIRRGENFSNVKGWESDAFDEINVGICKTDLPVIFENDAAIVVSNNRPIEDIAFHGHYNHQRYDTKGTQYEKTVNNDAMCTYNTSFSQELDYTQNHYMSSFDNSKGIDTNYPFTSPFIMFSGTGLAKSRDCSTVLHGKTGTGKLSLTSAEKYRLLNSAVCYYNIDKFDGRKFTKFNINFSKKFELVIDTGSKCSYGNWPHLHTDSYMEFDVIAEIDGDLYRLVQDDKKTYYFDYTGAWCGYEHTDGNYKTIVRSYVFGFNPYDINITLGSTNNKAVYDLSDSPMTIYVVPTGRVYFTSNKKTINYISCTLPRPSSTAKGSATSTIAINGSSNPKNFYTRTTPSKSATLMTTITLTTNGVSSFTICGDGFSVLSGSKAFGFGYGKFYNQFKKQDGYWGVSSDDLYLFCHEVTNPGSCSMSYMKAIPFSVLWDMAMNYRK